MLEQRLITRLCVLFCLEIKIFDQLEVTENEPQLLPNGNSKVHSTTHSEKFCAHVSFSDFLRTFLNESELKQC